MPKTNADDGISHLATRSRAPPPPPPGCRACVLYMIPFFLPVDVQHKEYRYPCRCLAIHREIRTGSAVTKLRHIYISRLFCSEQSRQCKLYVIVLDTTGTTYTFYERVSGLAKYIVHKAVPLYNQVRQY